MKLGATPKPITEQFFFIFIFVLMAAVSPLS
jgi:hypothetical protein